MRLVMALATVILLAAGAALAANELIVSEIMYNSVESTDVEWIEFYNNSGAPLDLTGWWVVDDDPAGHSHIPLSGVVPTGGIMVLAGTEALFTAKYPGVTNLFPVFFQTYAVEWSLGNSGDSVNVFNASDELVFTVTFDDAAPWPTAPDGTGPSLLLATNDCADFSSATCWTVGDLNGTPGVLTGTVPTETATWSDVKSLFH
jgi:hypothetical protein